MHWGVPHHTVSRDTPRLSLGSVTCDLLAVTQTHTPPFWVYKSISFQISRVSVCVPYYFLHIVKAISCAVVSIFIRLVLKPPQSFSIIVLNQPCNNNTSPCVIPPAIICAQAPQLLPNRPFWCLHCWQDTAGPLLLASHSHTVCRNEHRKRKRQQYPHSHAYGAQIPLPPKRVLWAFNF